MPAAPGDAPAKGSATASPLPIEDGVGLGVDIVEIERIRRILDRTPGFRLRVFTPASRNIATAQLSLPSIMPRVLRPKKPC